MKKNNPITKFQQKVHQIYAVCMGLRLSPVMFSSIDIKINRQLNVLQKYNN